MIDSYNKSPSMELEKKPAKKRTGKKRVRKSKNNSRKTSEASTVTLEPTSISSNKLNKKKKDRMKSYLYNQEVDDGVKPPVKITKDKSEEVLERKKMEMDKINDALTYLKLWSENRSEWKYKKTLQVLLIEKCLNRHIVSKDLFKIFRKYCIGLQGNAKTWLISLCQDASKEPEDESETTSKTAKARALKLLEILKCEDPSG